MTLKIAIPNKGRLSEKSLDLLQRAGIRVGYHHDRKLRATANGGEVELLYVRAKDIPEFVQDGVAHVGVTGLDLVRETGKDVEEVLDLGFGSCDLVLAVPENSSHEGPLDIPSGSRVATSFPNLTRSFFEDHGVDVEIIEVSGATEVTPAVGVADAITDLTSTGSTLARNHLRPVATILESTAHLVADPRALEDPEVEREVEDLRFALKSVLDAKGKRYLMANVPGDRLDEVRKVLPGVNGPTLVEIDDHGMVAAHAVVEDASIHGTVNRLKELGAEGILVLPIERFVP